MDLDVLTAILLTTHSDSRSLSQSASDLFALASMVHCVPLAKGMPLRIILPRILSDINSPKQMLAWTKVEHAASIKGFQMLIPLASTVSPFQPTSLFLSPNNL
eukprot:4132939-Amphidinium_carterae.1